MNLARLIVLDIRLPRAVLGVLIGGILGLSGAVLQGLLRNPLAEPGLLGVSSGASLGAVIAIYYGVATVAPLAPPLFGLVGGLVTAGAALLLARGGRHARADPLGRGGVRPGRSGREPGAQPRAEPLRRL